MIQTVFESIYICVVSRETIDKEYMNTTSEKANETLDAYLKRMLQINEDINLTSVTDYEQAKLLHLEDSLAIKDSFLKYLDGKYIDIGSGGGFPGVPLGVISGAPTLLVDSVQKKMKAVQQILDELNIKNIETCGMRIEDVSKDHPNEYGVVTARALTSLPALLELASPLLKQNGKLLAMKSKVNEDLDEQEAEEKLGLKLIEDIDYYLSDNETYRRLLIFEKVKPSSVNLPRRTGLAQKRPLLQ